MLGRESRAGSHPVPTLVTPLPGRSEAGGQGPKGARELLLEACGPASVPTSMSEVSQLVLAAPFHAQVLPPTCTQGRQAMHSTPF